MNGNGKNDVLSELHKSYPVPTETRSKRQPTLVQSQITSSFNGPNLGQIVYTNGQQLFVDDSKKMDVNRVSLDMPDSLQLNAAFNSFAQLSGGSDALDSSLMHRTIPCDHDLSELRATITPASVIETSSDTVMFDAQNAALKDVFATPQRIAAKDSSKDFTVPSTSIVRHRVSPHAKSDPMLRIPDHGRAASLMAPTLVVTASSDMSHDNQFLLPSNIRAIGTSGAYAVAGSISSLGDGFNSHTLPHRIYHSSSGKNYKKFQSSLEVMKEDFSVDSLDKQLSRHSTLSADSLFTPTSTADTGQALSFISDPNVLSQISQLAEISTDGSKERNFRQVDMLLSQLHNADDSDLSNLTAIPEQTGSLGVCLPPSPLLGNMSSDFLDSNAGIPKTSPNNLHTFLPNLSTTTDLALSFSSQFLENSNMSIDMGSFSGSEASFTTPHSFGEPLDSTGKKLLAAPELNFTNALKGVTERPKESCKPKSPLDIIKLEPSEASFVAPSRTDYAIRKRKCTEFVTQEHSGAASPVFAPIDITEPGKPTKKMEDKTSLVQQVSCFKCCVCAFLSLDKQEMAEHMINLHSKHLDEPTSKSDVKKERPPDEVKKKVTVNIQDQRIPSESSPQPRTKRLRKDSAKESDTTDSYVTTDPDESNGPTDTNTEDNSSNDDKTLKKRRPQTSHKEDMSKFPLRCGRNGCTLRLKEPRNMDYHQKCHVEAFLECPECKTKFSQWAMLAIHLWKIHCIDIELHTCELCPYKAYSYTKMMNNHWKTHSEERSFLCDNCGKGFKTAKQLRSHKVLHSAKKDEMRHNCEMCNRSFSDKRMLLSHLQAVHKKIKPYLCSFCGKSFASNSTLNLHTRKHTGEKPFGCESCSYRTSDHNSMRRHKMKHSNDKRYACPYCVYSSIQSSTYKAHLKRNHEVQAQKDGIFFSCSQCSFKTVKRDNYLSHMGTHHKISEEEQNRVANRQQENINNQLSKKRSPKKSLVKVNPNVALKEETFASLTVDDEVQQQQTYYVVQVPHVVNIDVNSGESVESPRSADLVNGILFQSGVPRQLSNQMLMSSVENFDTTILQQVDSENGLMQLTPEVVALPIGSSISSNVPGFIYVSGDVDSLEMAKDD